MRSAIEAAGPATYGLFRDEIVAATCAKKNVTDATWRLIKLREPNGVSPEDIGLAPENVR